MAIPYNLGATGGAQQIIQGYSALANMSSTMDGLSLSGGLDGDLGLAGSNLSLNGSIFGMSYPGSSPEEQARLSKMSYGEQQIYLMQEQEKVEEYQRQKNGRDYQKTTGQENLIARYAARAAELARENDQDAFLPAYNNLRVAVKQKLEKDGIPVTEEMIDTETQNAYYQINTTRVVDDLKQHGDDEFVSGIKQWGLFGLFGQKASARDNICAITHEEKPERENIFSGLGKAIGGLLTVVAIPAAALLLAKGGIRGGKAVGTGYKNLWKSIFSGKTAEAVVDTAKTISK